MQSKSQNLPKGPKISRPNWTRVHLVYFVLAAFDMIAVGTGLWLSNNTQQNFESSAASVKGTNFLYDRAAVLQRSAAELSGPVYELQYHRSPEKAEAALNAAEQRFNETVSEEGFVTDLKRHFGDGVLETLSEAKAAEDKKPEVEGAEAEGTDAAESGISGTKETSAEAMGDETTGGTDAGAEEVFASLLHVPVEVMEAYEESEHRVRTLGEAAAVQLRKAIQEFKQGRQESAAIAVGRASRSTAELQRSIAEQSQLADDYAHIVAANSSSSLAMSHSVQYGIGAFILGMVCLVMYYAHAMGKLLVGKFKEIEAAHEASEKYATRLAIVNDDVSKLNIDLAENMKRLSIAQDEILKKGRMEQLGHLTATVAHELRNPLGAVRTSAFLLERKIKGKNTGLEPQIHRINNGVVRCDDIITQLLDFSRSAAASLEPVDLDNWLQKLVEDEVQKLPASVEVEFAPGLAGSIVPIDGARLCRAIINLLSNASEAMVGKGDDPSKFAAANPKIVIATRLTQRGAEISVSDNGPGIKHEDFAKVLEPLYTTKNFGTGLGLPAVKRIMEQHCGGLDIASEPGQGASFTIWVPLLLTATRAA